MHKHFALWGRLEWFYTVFRFSKLLLYYYDLFRACAAQKEAETWVCSGAEGSITHFSSPCSFLSSWQRPLFLVTLVRNIDLAQDFSSLYGCEHSCNWFHFQGKVARESRRKKNRDFPPLSSDCVLCSVTLAVSDSLWPYVLKSSTLLCPWDSPSKNTGVGCQGKIQAIFLIQKLNLHLLCLLHCRWILYHWATREADFRL